MKKFALLVFGVLFAFQIAAYAAPSEQGAFSKVAKEENSTKDISPTGWSKGNKTGWDGNALPPGQAK